MGTPEPNSSERRGGGGDPAWARTRVASAARAAILDLGIRNLVRVETSLTVLGLEQLERLDGPAIFVSNHTSHLDATIILATLPRRLRERTAVGAAKDYFFDVWWRREFVALAFAAFPVERGGGERATEVARELLRQRWNLVVFPEGSRSKDGWMQRFRHGTARLAIDSGAAIVPIAIVGAYAAMPKGRWWPLPGRPPVRIRYGTPFHAQEGERHQDLSLRAQRAVAELLDEEVPAWVAGLPERHRGWSLDPKGPELPRWTQPIEDRAPESGPDGP
ncbi:MAG: lysophospholipid acyltransferase family protein [Actinomycetota bacterium]